MDVGLSTLGRKCSPHLARLLKACADTGASDLHLAPDQPPLIRQSGILKPVPDEAAFAATELATLCEEMMAHANRQQLVETGSCDGALTSPEGLRFRFNVFRRGGFLCAALRKLEDRFRSLKELGLPEHLYSLCDLPDGLIVVAGPTGAGKSTSLAAMIHKINVEESVHIVTIEDPVEYIHVKGKALVNQRQLGADCSSFNEALIASLRQDPDVILVGEIRELNTIKTAITAAETGHLVFTTVHAGDCAGVVERLVSVFPAGEQDGIRRQLSLVLRGVLVQQLMLADGPAMAEEARQGKRKRVVATELLIVNPAVANLIASGKSAQVYSQMEVGGREGMQTLEQDLARLIVNGTISEQTANGYSKNKHLLRERVAQLRGRGAGGKF